jgi:hypothetical protein
VLHRIEYQGGHRLDVQGPRPGSGPASMTSIPSMTSSRSVDGICLLDSRIDTDQCSNATAVSCLAGCSYNTVCAGLPDSNLTEHSCVGQCQSIEEVPVADSCFHTIGMHTAPVPAECRVSVSSTEVFAGRIVEFGVEMVDVFGNVFSSPPAPTDCPPGSLAQDCNTFFLLTHPTSVSPQLPPVDLADLLVLFHLSAEQSGVYTAQVVYRDVHGEESTVGRQEAFEVTVLPGAADLSQTILAAGSAIDCVHGRRQGTHNHTHNLSYGLCAVCRVSYLLSLNLNPCCVCVRTCMCVSFLLLSLHRCRICARIARSVWQRM